MLTLCMDTSHRYLTLALIKDDMIIGKFQKECFKRQSETILEELDELCKKVGITNTMIDSVCITKGPGSYTGVRIAMTIAKIFCTSRNLPLYTLSSLRLFSCGKENCIVLMDARGKRAYYVEYENGIEKEKERIVEIDELKQRINPLMVVMGDRNLLDLDVVEEDYAQSFLTNKRNWHKEENPHTCVPEYLKENSEYLIK